MTLEIALEHLLELWVAAALLDSLSQCVPGDIAHSCSFDLRGGERVYSNKRWPNPQANAARAYWKACI